MASGGYDKLVCANDSRAPLELKKFRISSDVESLSWSPFNENLHYCSGEDGMMSVFDMRSDKLLYNLQAHDGASCVICLSPFFENLMLTASSDSTCKLWDLNNGQPKLLTTRKMRGGKLFDCMFDLLTRFSPNDNGICCLGGSSGDLIVWDIGNLASVAGVFGIQPKHKELVVLEDQTNEE